MTPSNQVEMPADSFFATLDAMAPAGEVFSVRLSFTRLMHWALAVPQVFAMDLFAASQEAAEEMLRNEAIASGFSGEVML